ncbi:MAG TPA: redoxin domain-containing (seleno)protein, partial [Bryobacteraceae bacterium]
MNRRDFLLISGASVAATAATSTTTATVLYGDKAVPVESARPADPHNLWVRAADMKGINGFELKPQGACREDVCIPVDKKLHQGALFNLTGFAEKVHQPVVADSGVWSFGDIPLLRSAFVES